MKAATVPSKSFNVILMPGQTAEEIIEAFKNMSELGLSGLGGAVPEDCIPDVKAKVEVTLTEGRLTTAVVLQAIESRFQNLGRAV